MIDLLVMGGSGFIGGRTVQAAQKAGLNATCTYLHRPPPPGVPAFQLDGGDASLLDACLNETRPRGIIYSVVCGNFGNNSEVEHQYTSYTVLRTLLESLNRAGLSSRLVYVSTNAVFSGNAGPYRENDLPDPEMRQDVYRPYGFWRRAGEMLVLEQWPDAVVARTANVDGRDAWGQINTRLKNLIDPLLAGQAVRRYVDRGISPTLVDNLADMLVEVAQPDFRLPAGRVLHLSGCEPVSDFQYARRLASKLGVSESLVGEDYFLPSGSSDRYSIALDVTYTQSLLKTPLLGLDEMLDRILIR